MVDQQQEQYIHHKMEHLQERIRAKNIQEVELQRQLCLAKWRQQATRLEKVAKEMESMQSKGTSFERMQQKR